MTLPDYERVKEHAAIQSHLGGDSAIYKSDGQHHALDEAFYVLDDEREVVLTRYSIDNYAGVLGFVEGYEEGIEV